MAPARIGGPRSKGLPSALHNVRDEGVSSFEREPLPKSPAQATALRLSGSSWTDQEIRSYYLEITASIPSLNEGWKKSGLNAEKRAHLAYEIRHNARLTSRAMMADQDYVQNELRPRDMQKYGNPDGPTFEWLVEKEAAGGLMGDARYEAIVTSSQRTDKATNQKLGLAQR